MADRVVITGATSFLGRYVVNSLKTRGCQVYAIIRPTSKNVDAYSGDTNVITILYEMGDVDGWTAKIGRADYFIHLGWDGIAAQGRADSSIQERNVSAALNCLKGAASLGCKAFLFAGSQAEYGPQTGIITEETFCNPVIEYGKGKLKVLHDASELAKQLAIRYYHTRIFSVYGEGDHTWALVPSCIRTLCNGEDMKLSSCTQKWNYLYATDAGEVLSALLLSGAPSGIYNIASRDTRTLKEFVQLIHSACSGSGKLVFGGYASTEKQVSLQPDISKLISVIKYIPETPFEEVIVRMVNKYRSTGEL